MRIISGRSAVSPILDRIFIGDLSPFTVVLVIISACRDLMERLNPVVVVCLFSLVGDVLLMCAVLENCSPRRVPRMLTLS